LLIGAIALLLAGQIGAPQPASIGAASRHSDADPLEAASRWRRNRWGKTASAQGRPNLNIPGWVDVLAEQHAEDRHGVEALQARLAIQSGGYNRYDCKDGRVRIVKQIARAAFAIVIVEGGVEVSAFISERTAQAIARLIERDGCLPPGSPFGGALAN
jgi:hypothetical protein